jgi:hypothetical protein
VELAAGQLVELDLKLDKLAPMRLAADWYGPVGACLPTTQVACPGAVACQSGEVCDLDRGACRRADATGLCVLDGDCQAGEHCVPAREKLASLLEPTGSTSMHRIVANLGSLFAGTHYLVVYDSLGALADRYASYHLAVTTSPDPDTYEVNDDQGLATDITAQVAAGQTVDAYLSHLGGVEGGPSASGDIDWYVVRPSGSTRPVVGVELRSLANSNISPTYTLYQGGVSFPSAKVKVVGAGVTAERVRSGALVMPDPSLPIYVKVNDTGRGFDATTLDGAGQYHLTVTLTTDASEPATRDDTPDTARVFSAGLPAAGATYSASGTIVAENDQDWYRVDRDPANTDHALLHLGLQSASTNVLLQLTTFVPSPQSCSVDDDCNPQPGRCLASHTCIVGWLQRPSPDGPGDPQLGGLTPNVFDSMQPLPGTGPGALYVLVSNNASTTLDRPGYSSTDTYTLALTQVVEPDAEDRLDPDNRFVSRPLAVGVGRGNLFDHARPITPTVSGGTGGAAFVRLAAGSVATVGACVTLGLEAYDALGQPATGTTQVTLAASDTTAVLAASCGGAALTGPLSISGDTGSVAYTAGATADLGTTLTTTVASPAVLALGTLAAAATPLAFVASSTPLPRRVAQGLRSDVVRLQLPPAVATPIVLQVASTNGTVACARAVAGVCPAPSPAPAGLTNPCVGTLGQKASCQIVIASGQTYDLVVSPTALGLVALTASDPAAVLPPATWVAAVTTPLGLTASSPGTGLLTYEGDQDFYTIPLSGFPGAGMTVTFDMPASSIELRVLATRADHGAGAQAAQRDDCPTGCDGGGQCDPTRKTCNQAAFHFQYGAAASTPSCLWAPATADTIEIWVNDVWANDWDLTHPYAFTIRLDEGCPALCAGVAGACTP